MHSSVSFKISSYSFPSLCLMCISEDGITRKTASAPLSITASISFLFPLAKLSISALKFSFAISFIASNSPFVAAAKPASIASTPSSSSFFAILNLSSGFRETPGVCSPSLSVVSKILIFSVKLFDDKAIPHFQTSPPENSACYIKALLF